MNILFECIVYYPHKGGAESLIEDLATEFIQKGHRVTVVTQRYPRCLPAFENRRGIDIMRLVYPPDAIKPLRKIPQRIWQFLAVSFRFYRIMKSRKIDTVCIGLFGRGALFLLLLRYIMKFKLIVCIHGGEIREYIKFSKVFRLMLRETFKICNIVIAVSDKLKEDAIKFAPFVRDKIFTIPNGVDLERIKSQSTHRHHREYILYSGRLHPVKGIDTLIKAFCSISDRVPDLDLLIAGTGSEADRLKRMVSGYGLQKRVNFLGEQEKEKVFSLLKGCQFLVLPSYSEGCPLTILEAMAAGKMTIGSNIEGINEIIENGKNGILFKTAGAKELSQLILKYYIDNAERSRIENYIKNSNFKKYDIQEVSKEHLKVYQRN